MDWTSPHVGFTLLAYLVSAIALLALSLSVLIKGRNLRKRLEQRGQGTGTSGEA